MLCTPLGNSLMYMTRSSIYQYQDEDGSFFRNYPYPSFELLKHHIMHIVCGMAIEDHNMLFVNCHGFVQLA